MKLFLIAVIAVCVASCTKEYVTNPTTVVNHFDTSYVNTVVNHYDTIKGNGGYLPELTFAIIDMLPDTSRVSPAWSFSTVLKTVYPRIDSLLIRNMRIPYPPSNFVCLTGDTIIAFWDNTTAAELHDTLVVSRDTTWHLRAR